jgi:hypothetical protein
MTARVEVPALHEDEVITFLDRVGVRAAYENGELSCSICESPLIKLGLGAARVSGGRVVFVCTRLDCLDDFQRR